MTGMTLIWWALLTNDAPFFEVSQRGGRNARKSLSTFAAARASQVAKKYQSQFVDSDSFQESGG